MSDVIGLSLREGRVDGVVVRRRFSGTRVLNTFSLSTDEDVGTALRARLRDLGVRTRRVHIGIPRRLAVVKALEFPAVAGGDLRRMVGFELERHLPFPPADALFDFDVLQHVPGRPIRVLLVATERRTFDHVKQLFRDAGFVPRLVDVAIHSLALLAGGRHRVPPRHGRIVVRLEEAQAELAIVGRGRLLGSRAFPLPPDPTARGQTLTSELSRSLASLSAEDRKILTEVTVTGDALPPIDWRELPVRAGMPGPPGLSRIDAAFLPALGMALRQPIRGAFHTNLMPDELRPRPFPWPIAVTASLAAATLLLATAIPAVTMLRDKRILADLNRKIEQRAPDIRRVEQLASAVERARREVETLRSFEAQSVRALPVLRELTELLPADVWLTNLSADRSGIELAGFAGAASQLIPLLDASPTLDRVEFTSPVTKGRDREQFRLKASWDQPAGAAPAARGASATPSRPVAPARPPEPGTGG